jgi:hypothetical protein
MAPKVWHATAMIDDLLVRIAEFHRSRSPFPEFPMVAEVLDVLDVVESPTTMLHRPRLDVVRHLVAVRPTGIDPAIDAIIEEFVRIGADLPWRQTASYRQVLDAAYLANYGYVQLVGPAPAIIEHPSVRIGLGLWGPSLVYPLHKHPAEELYHVLFGEPLFGNGTDEWRATAPGDAVHHRPWQLHAQRFADTPTVLLYSWVGDVKSDAVLVGCGNDPSRG